MTYKKDRYFIVNRMLNFALRFIEGSFSCKKNYQSHEFTYTNQFSTLEKIHVTEFLLEKNLQIKVLSCKRFLRDTGQIEYLDDEQLAKIIIESNVSVDGPG